MGKRKQATVAITGFAVLLLVLGQLPFMQAYFGQLKSTMPNDSLPAAIFSRDGSEAGQSGTARDQERLNAIRKEAERLNVPPIDARIDRVWKAIPGYNGLEVDVERSLQLAKDWVPGTKVPILLKEIRPQLSLDDLELQPIYKGNPNKPMVSLMINVAWGNEYLPSMLETLDNENVRATFFLDGSWLSKNVETAKHIAELGHEVSNHGYSHKDMSKLNRQQAIEEIAKTEKLLKEQLGVTNQWFAPPSGDYDDETVAVAHELKLKTILWTIDTVDWMKPTPESIINKISRRLEPGAMILMHPTESSSKALESIIREVKERDMVLGTVSELLSSDRVPDREDRLFYGINN